MASTTGFFPFTDPALPRVRDVNAPPLRRKSHTAASRDSRSGARSEVSARCRVHLPDFSAACGADAAEREHTMADMALMLYGGIRADDEVSVLTPNNYVVVLKGCGTAQARRKIDALNGTLAAYARNRQPAHEPVAPEVSVELSDSACGRGGMVQSPSNRGRHPFAGIIRRAISSERLVLHGQAITDLRQPRQSCNLEVLVRSRAESGRIMQPSTFIPAAERLGFAHELDYAVLEKALDWLSQAPQSAVGFCAINLSAQSIGEHRVANLIDRALVAGSIDPARVCFEITETSAISDLDRTREFIAWLREAGCLFALDDFGSGCASFDYLRHLDVQIVKIDGSFVRGMARERFDFAAVRAINTLAHDLGKRTIAEHVERPGLLPMLNEMGVDFAQGYHFGQPVAL